MTAEICPGCAQAYGNPDSGLCDGCEDERLRIRYGDDERAVVEKRQAWWRDRQRAHRFRKRLRPAEPLVDNDDPLDIGVEALDALASLAPYCKTATATAVLDSLREMVKQLSWGPEG